MIEIDELAAIRARDAAWIDRYDYRKNLAARDRRTLLGLLDRLLELHRYHDQKVAQVLGELVRHRGIDD